MKTITGADNPTVKRLAKLRSRKGREAENTFLAEGFSIVAEAFSSPLTVKNLIIEEKQAESSKGKRLLPLAESAKTEILLLPEAVFAKISALETPRGVAAEIARPKQRDWKSAKPIGISLLVEQLRDPRNMGLLARTALAAGVEAIYLTEDSVDPFHPFAVQASMGAAFHLPVHTGVAAADVISHFKKNKGLTFATAPRGGIAPAELKNHKEPLLIVLGNESRGVSDEALKLCGAVVTIPISPKAESLNIAVAAGVLCFQYMSKLKLF